MNNNNTTAGYINACGLPEARLAIAKHHSTLLSSSSSSASSSSTASTNDEEMKYQKRRDVTMDDVIIANGASGALELALTALLDHDSVLLVPRPGFPLYQVIAESHGASVVHYNLQPDNGWECDIEHMESIILGEEQRCKSKSSSSLSYSTVSCDDNQSKTKVVRGILINNPSNPTGAVYSEEHLMQIVTLAEKYQIPIISDEIYGDMTFGCKVFHPMANVAAKMGYRVPIITASGLGKQYLVPGWRLGWIVFQDNTSQSLQEVKRGAQRLAQVILGASHLPQVAISAVLDPSDEAERMSIMLWKDNLYSTVERQAKLLCGLLSECHGLDVIFPDGAMYAMVRIKVEKFDKHIYDDVSFMKLLLEEENIVVLPGCAFGLENEIDCVFRVVFCAPEHILRTASERITSFCLRHECLDD